MSVEMLYGKLKEATTLLKEWKPDEVKLVFHDDADGISSGAIVKSALGREGYRVKCFCVERLLRQILEELHGGRKQTIFYADIGSGHAGFISTLNKGSNLTVILDHHDPTESTDPLVLNINPEFYGLKGERDASGSTICYLFAKTLSVKNRDLAPVALIGTREIPGEPSGLNRVVEEDAGEFKGNGKINAAKFFSLLQILGPVGYYQDGPLDGIRACLEGLSREVEDKVRRLEEQRKQANRKLLSILFKQGLKETEHVQWFDSHGVFRGMGTKVLGTFCSYISHIGRLVKPDKYLVGMMEMPSEIPGLTRLRGEWVKVSVRAPKGLGEKIEAAKMPPVVGILVETAEGLGGLADGHGVAGSAALPKDKTATFIKELERVIQLRQQHPKA